MADPFIRELAAYLSFDGGTDGGANFSAAIYTPPWFSRYAGTVGPVVVEKRGSPTYSTAKSRFGSTSLRVTAPNYVRLTAGNVLSANPLTRPPGGAITFSGWFWLDSTADCRIMGCYAGNTGGSEYAWGVGISGGKLRLAANRAQVGVGLTTVTPGAWHHIECVQETGFGHRVYLDGNLEVSGGFRYTMGEGFELGGYSLSDGLSFATMSGYISEVSIWFAVMHHGATFSVPSSALDLTGLPSFKDAARATSLGVLRQPLFGVAAGTALTGPRRVRDEYFGGTGKVVGDVAVDDDPDVPVARKVWLVRMRDGQVIREQWSDPVAGGYAFVGVDMSHKYAVLAFDHTGIFRAVVADNISPEPM